MSKKKLSNEVLRTHKGISFVGVSTCFFCHDGNGSFFMSKRSKNTRDEQETWEFGGGGLKWGETAEASMTRELKEEYGAEPKEIRFLGYSDVFRTLEDGTLTHWLRLDFAVLVDRSEMRNAEPEAIDDSGWFTLDNLPKPLHSQQPVFIKQYKKELKELLG